MGMMFVQALAVLIVLFVVQVESWHPRAARFHVRAFMPRIASLLQSSRTINSIVPSSWPSTTALSFKVSETDEVDVEEDEDVDEDEDGSGGSVMLRKISKGMPLVAASLGFAVTPSSAIAARIAGAAAGGVAGLLAQQVILARIKTAEGDGGDDNDDSQSGGGGMMKVTPSVVQAIAALRKGPPISSFDLKSLEQAARKFRISNDDLGEFFTHVFAEVVYEAVTQSDSEDLTELSEVVDFAEGVGLSISEIGDGFAIATSRLGRQIDRDERGFFELSESPEELLLQAAKVFFLADKMISVNDGYYGKRLAVTLSFFTNDELKDVVTSACTSLFKRCVESVLINPEAFSAEEVGAMKEFLDSTARYVFLSSLHNASSPSLPPSLPPSLRNIHSFSSPTCALPLLSPSHNHTLSLPPSIIIPPTNRLIIIFTNISNILTI